MSEDRTAPLARGKAKDVSRGSDRPVFIDLPPITDAKSLAEAQARVIAAAAAGKRVTPRQGVAFATMLELQRRALATAQSERALDKIDALNAERIARAEREAKEEEEDR
jgi:hypothetical protein